LRVLSFVILGNN